MISPDTVLPYPHLSERSTKIVAVIGWINDFSSYEGYPMWADNEVASNGDKISETEAREYFPELATYSYRR